MCYILSGLICCQIYKIAHQDFRTSEITNFELVCMWVNLQQKDYSVLVIIRKVHHFFVCL
jgi:hypothetical protein